MQPKLILTPLGQYAPAKWGGQNTSGVEPIAERVVVLPDAAAEQTAGSVHITEEMQERMTMAAESGVLVAAAIDAWSRSADRTGPYKGRRPEVGERVKFERYAGAVHHGVDGRLYRVMDDTCIAGIIDADAATSAKPATPGPKIAKVIKPPLVMARGA
jgi:co-chaperonin GroES (HSP10)